MTQHILIAFDDSENALRAVAYVAKQFRADDKITLFNVSMDTETLCKMNSPELTPYFKSQQSAFCVLEEKKKDLVGEAMNTAKKMLMDAGFAAENINFKVHAQKSNVAKDILDESESGYDLIVLGRTGKSGMREFFLGSTPLKVFNHAKNISILVVS
jgi:nucleotide-binding universal stress UspA family protein